MKPLHPELPWVQARCAELRTGACPGNLCEHWIDYTGAERFESPDVAPVGRCRMVDEAGISVCRRDPDPPAQVASRMGEPLRDWFGPGHDEWSFWNFPSETEYRDWIPTDADCWDRREWRAKRYQRRKAWKRA